MSLIERVRARDADAWDRLADLYGPLVYHWCRRLGLESHDAADILQDVFSAVAGAIDRFRTNGRSSFRGWLWTITRNKVNDYHRRRAGSAQAAGGTNAHQMLAAVPDIATDDSRDVTDPRELSGLFHRALELVRSEFEDRTWQAFWRSTVDEEPTRDIAADLGITANAVRQARSRVLRRLRQELGDAN